MLPCRCGRLRLSRRGGGDTAPPPARPLRVQDQNRRLLRPAPLHPRGEDPLSAQPSVDETPRHPVRPRDPAGWEGDRDARGAVPEAHRARLSRLRDRPAGIRGVRQGVEAPGSGGPGFRRGRPGGAAAHGGKAPCRPGEDHPRRPLARGEPLLRGRRDRPAREEHREHKPWKLRVARPVLGTDHAALRPGTGERPRPARPPPLPGTPRQTARPVPVPPRRAAQERLHHTGQRRLAGGEGVFRTALQRAGLREGTCRHPPQPPQFRRQVRRGERGLRHPPGQDARRRDRHPPAIMAVRISRAAGARTAHTARAPPSPPA